MCVCVCVCVWGGGERERERHRHTHTERNFKRGDKFYLFFQFLVGLYKQDIMVFILTGKGQ